MRRVILVAVIFLVVGLLSVGGFFGWRALQTYLPKMVVRNQEVPEEVVLDGNVKIQTPVSMLSTDVPSEGRPPSAIRSDYFKSKKGDLSTYAFSHRLPSGTLMDSSFIAGKLAERFRSPEYAKKENAEAVEVFERKLEVLGGPAFEVVVSGRQWGRKFRGRVLVFSKKSTGYMVGMDTMGDLEPEDMWKKMKDSIQWVGPTEEFKDTPGLSSGSPQLPPGFTPRNLGTKEKSDRTKGKE